MTVQIINYSSIVEENGKTIRENNLEIKHAIPVGTLVEITGNPDAGLDYDYNRKWQGVRLFVLKHTRDCDGTPLYTLGPNEQPDPELPSIMHRTFGGFSEDGLRVVKAATP